jgi:2,3-bisphosphoglycerate-dependent phosphoglycerate mutase
VTRLVLIRHGESHVTVQRVIGGLRSCTGLTPLGHGQASALAARAVRTGELATDVLYSSTLPRAIETAVPLAGALGVEMVLDERLIEHAPGECDGMTFDDYVRCHPMRSAWGSEPDAEIFPGGETHGMFRARVSESIGALCAKHAGGTIVVVCHGGVIDAAMRHLLGLPVFGAFELNIVNTSITEVVRREERWALLRFNDAAHLEGVAMAPDNG